jgi:hypothetical protein
MALGLVFSGPPGGKREKLINEEYRENVGIPQKIEGGSVREERGGEKKIEIPAQVPGCT